MREIPSLAREGATITLLDRKGVARRVFDFSTLGFGRRLAEAMARAFAVRFGSCTVETQSLAWQGVRRLAEAVALPEGPAIQTLPKDTVFRLRDALLRSGLAPKTAQARINVCIPLIEWCMRNEPRVIDKRATTLVPTLYQRTASISRPAIPEELVKRVLAACYRDIEAVENKLALGRRLQEEGAQPGDSAQLLAAHQLLQATGGRLPLRSQLDHRLSRMVDDAGGLREIAQLMRLTAQHAFPFYLAILAQTGANPMALRLLRRDCVRPHPLVSNLERMVWDKPRSGKEQFVDFPASKVWSASNLVRRLAALNSAIVPVAHTSEREFLFLASPPGAQRASVPSWMSLHQHLDRFIAKHGLPTFDLAGFRTNVAKAHHRQAGSIKAAQQRLHHADEGSTSRYTPLADRAADHDRVVASFQGRLVREALGEEPRWAEDAKGTARQTPHETVFGFQCADPFEGLAPGSVTGKLCLQFQRCATCPGALIPLDDVQVVARLVATRRHLEATGARAKKEGWWDRFLALYAPILQILSKELLPAVAYGVRVKAETHSRLIVLPHLE